MIGIVALATAVFIAAIAVSTFEAWWAIALVAVGVIVLAVERSALRRKDAIPAAVGLIGSIFLGAAGAWILLLSQFGRARPCDACFDNGVLLLPGLVIFIVVIVIATVCLREIVRGFSRTIGAESAHDMRQD